jgi:hypothetical protein
MAEATKLRAGGSDCSFFGVQVALVFSVFAILHILDNCINGSFLQVLFPVIGFHHLYYFSVVFAGSGKVGDEVLDAHHSTG